MVVDTSSVDGPDGTQSAAGSPRSLIALACAFAVVAGQVGCGANDGSVISNSVGMTLKRIPAGEFQMGAPESDDAAEDDERPQHLVRITKPFYMSVHEVTQDAWTKVMTTTPWKDQRVPVKEGGRYPAAYVSWEDAIAFCDRLTQEDRTAGLLKEGEAYRLPTEAEWEYACRAGSTTRFFFGDDDSSLADHAWYGSNSSDPDSTLVYAHEVGTKKPNAWGLYDMAGNVGELCSDRRSTGYYSESPVDDPHGPSDFPNRVVRGSSFFSSPKGCRSTYRSELPPDERWFSIGFRVVRTIRD